GGTTRSSRGGAGADGGAAGETPAQGAEGARRVLRPLPGRPSGGDRAPRLRRQGAVRAGVARADRGLEEGLWLGPRRLGQPPAAGERRERRGERWRIVTSWPPSRPAPCPTKPSTTGTTCAWPGFTSGSCPRPRP